MTRYQDSGALGGQAEDLKRFAGEVFTKKRENVFILCGESVRRPLRVPQSPAGSPRPDDVQTAGLETTPFINDSGSELYRNALATDMAREAVRLIVPSTVIGSIATDSPAVFLHEALSRSPLVANLESILWNERGRGPLTIGELARALWETSDTGAVRATASLLQLCARARCTASDMPLIPHKLHLLVRAPSTISACLNRDCAASGPRMPNGGELIAEAAERCPTCGSALLTLSRCSTCGESLLAGVRRIASNTLHPRHRWNDDPPEGTTYLFCRPSTEQPGFQFDLDTARCESEPQSIAMQELKACPNCGTDSADFEGMRVPDALMLPVVAEGLLYDMPVIGSETRKWLPASGRRLLVFSGSRREAARLGPLLTHQHESQMSRAMITRHAFSRRI